MYLDLWFDDIHDGATHENADRTRNGLPDQYQVGGEMDRGEPIEEILDVEAVDELMNFFFLFS